MNPFQRFGDYLHDNLPEMKQRVEDKLDFKIGEIELIPLPFFNHLDKVADIFYNILYFPEKFWEIFNITVATATAFPNTYYVDKERTPVPSKIKYESSPAVLTFIPRYMQHLGLHEITHIAYSELVKKGFNEARASEWVLEGFAEYVAVDIMKEQGLIPCNTFSEPYYKIFLKALSIENINDYNGVKEFVIGIEEGRINKSFRSY